MTTPPDKACHKALRRHGKEQGYADARSTFPLTPEQLDALHDHLETYGEPVGCDRTRPSHSSGCIYPSDRWQTQPTLWRRIYAMSVAPPTGV